MRIVFDLDETICVHRDRDYKHAAPVSRVISRMVELKRSRPDCEIVIHTARGMKSCNGDATAADKKNRAVTEDWLKRHGVPYDSLVFGKPFADAYVDDKAVSREEWERLGWSRMYGFSGKPLDAVGNIVIKPDVDARHRDWYEEYARLGLVCMKTPTVISWSFGNLFLRRVNGSPLARLDTEDVFRALPSASAAIREMGSRIQVGMTNNITAYAAIVRARAEAAGMDDTRAARLECDLQAVRAACATRTFCHGDFTTTNILSSNEWYYVIDPSDTGKEAFSTYLLDAAKMRACLVGLEEAITGRDRDGEYERAAAFWDSLWTPAELTAIRTLARTYLVRVAAKAIKTGRPGVCYRLLEAEARCAAER